MRFPDLEHCVFSRFSIFSEFIQHKFRKLWFASQVFCCYQFALIDGMEASTDKHKKDLPGAVIENKGRETHEIVGREVFECK